jgi:integrase
MSITKRALKHNKISWGYQFSVGPRATREQHKAGGFRTKDEAQKAEAAERLKAAAIPQPQANPRSIAQMIASFIEDGKENRSPKTTARYREMAAYLSREIAGKPIREVTALMLHEEWKRLRASGGHDRKTKTPRPLSAKTVRNIAGVVSAAYAWAILYQLAEVNPVSVSKPPTGGEKRRPVALSMEQQRLLIEAASGPWCLGTFLEVEAGLGARRGEVLALRWSDLRDGYAHIARSLGQAGSRLYYKDTKTREPRIVEVPQRTLNALATHRAKQAEFRAHLGAEYRADKDLIFATPEGDELRPDSVSSTVSALCRRLKLPKGASLHALRHTHGSQLLDAGVPITEVSERLGHSSPRTTLAVYSHAIPGRSRAARIWDEMHQEGSTEVRQ